MKQIVKKLCLTVLSVMVVLLMMSAISSASAETLRLLIWRNYTFKGHNL